METKFSDFQKILATLGDNVEKVIKGKREKIDIILISMAAQGHILIEDVPGVGKTMLARSIAQSINGDFQRIQFTNDLLPTDILGNYIYIKNEGKFSFRKGPIFTNILLADEINRGTPKVQSALLEGMEEYTVSIDRNTHPLPSPFFVIATENPIEQGGTFILPEAELDRFLIKIPMGYPSAEKEKDILKEVQIIHPIERIEPVVAISKILSLQKMLKNVEVTALIREYIINLITKTRDNDNLLLGASPRASIALQKMAQGNAAFKGRNFVIPDDVKNIFVPVLRHRLRLTPQARINGLTSDIILENLINETEAPR
ncbi:MoxR family ATPase [bacterium]|nr:MoxR family ATPase [bacterium]